MITELACDEHGLDREALIFDALTFTLTTGDDEWKPSAVATIDGIRAIKKELPASRPSLGVSNVRRRVARRPRGAELVSFHHCVEAGLDLAMVNPNHITPYFEISRRSASSPTTSSTTGARTPSNASSRTSSRRASPRRTPAARIPPRAWSPRRRSTS